MDDEKQTAQDQTGINLKLAFYGGAGIGLLFGIIMGTTTTPTVTAMLGALTAVLAALLGLNDTHFNNAKAVRIGSFGFACVLGAYMGMFVRSHNLLAPSPQAVKAELLQLGFSEQRALQLVLAREYGIGSSEDAADNTGSTISTEALAQIGKRHSSMLFSANTEISGCDELRGTDNKLPLDEVINNFELVGGVWQDIASKVSSELDQKQQLAVLLAAKQAVCKNPKATSVSLDCSWVKNAQSANFSAMLKQYRSQTETWQDLALAIDNTRFAAQEKSRALVLLTGVMCASNQQGQGT